MVGEAISALTGNSNSRREVVESISARQGIAGAAEKVVADTLGDTIKKGLTNGLGSALGGTAVGGIISALTGDNNKRELSAREEVFSDLLARHLATREPLGAVGKGLLGTGVSLVGSSLASEAVSDIESLFKKRALGAVGKGLLGTGVSLVGSSLASEAINGIESLFDREMALNELD